jgi:hypothetical protein
LPARGKRKTGELTLAGPDARAGIDDDEASSFCSKKNQQSGGARNLLGEKKTESNIC